MKLTIGTVAKSLEQLIEEKYGATILKKISSGRGKGMDIIITHSVSGFEKRRLYIEKFSLTPTKTDSEPIEYGESFIVGSNNSLRAVQIIADRDGTDFYLT